MITLNQIKDYVNNSLNVNLQEETRKRKVVYARVIFTNLVLIHCKKTSLQTIAKFANLKNHATVIRYRDVTLDVIRVNEPEIYNIYKMFNTLNIVESDRELELKNNFQKLHDMYVDVQIRLIEAEKRLNMKLDNKEFLSVLNSVPDDKLDLFYLRIKPIAKMLNSHVVR